MTWLLAAIGMVVAAWAVRNAVHMGPDDCHSMRVGVVLLGAAGLSAMLSPAYGMPPAWLYVAGMAGALLFISGPPRAH